MGAAHYTTGDASRTAAPGTGEPVELIEPDDHYLDWLKCIRSRGTCVAPIEAGYQHAVAVLMAVKAFDQGKRQVYDADRREILPGCSLAYGVKTLEVDFFSDEFRGLVAKSRFATMPDFARARRGHVARQHASLSPLKAKVW